MGDHTVNFAQEMSASILIFTYIILLMVAPIALGLRIWWFNSQEEKRRIVILAIISVIAFSPFYFIWALPLGFEAGVAFAWSFSSSRGRKIGAWVGLISLPSLCIYYSPIANTGLLDVLGQILLCIMLFGPIGASIGAGTGIFVEYVRRR